MKVKTWCSLLLILLLLALAGCGKTDSNSQKDAEPKEQTSASAEEQKTDPVTITLNLERSGLGENVEYTFTKVPSAVVASGDQMADFFFDLGLEDRMAGYTKGSCWSLVSEYAARDTVPQVADPGVGLSSLSKEELLATGCDFLMGWDSVFSDKNFSPDFCKENGISMYFPYVCSDTATFEDLYKDYETLGAVFHRVFVYDSGEDAPFTACQGMPGDMIRLAGGISIFDDIEAGWATSSWEEVVERDPDVILILDYNGDTEQKAEFLKTHAATKNLRAVQEGRIYSACCSDMQGSAGSAVAVRSIAKQLHPDLFR